MRNGLAPVDRHDFVDAVAVDEAAVEHRDLRIGERQELAVQVDDLRSASGMAVLSGW